MTAQTLLVAMSSLVKVTVQVKHRTLWNNESVAAGMGGKGEHPPPVALCRGGIWRGKIWNFEIWPLLANWHLHCRTDSVGSLV